MSILVIGAGELGMAILEALVMHHGRGKSPITVLLRHETINSQDATKKKAVEHINNAGVGIESGDIVKSTVSDLVKIFSKHHTIIGCSGLGLPSGTQLKIAKAVLEAKIPRFFPWQFGVDYDTIGEGSAQDLFDEQLEVRKLLRAQKTTDWIIVSNGLFMSFLFVPGFGPVDLENRIARALGSWDTQVTVTTAEDIAKMVAEVTFQPDGISHQVVFIGGDTVSYSQVADLLDAKYRTKFKRELWDIPLLKAELAKDPENMMRKYREVFAAGQGVAWDLSKTLNVARGIQLTSAEAFIKDL
jgi:hypothetical protein